MAFAARKLHEMKMGNAFECSTNKMDSGEHIVAVLQNNGGSGWEKIAETKLNIPRAGSSVACHRIGTARTAKMRIKWTRDK